MATSDPLLACNHGAIWYNFPYTLSWSNKCESMEVLSDIPFISVGILIFGVSALFLVVKRISLSTVSLFFSALLASVAAALDLSQTLAYGMAINTTFVASGHVAQARDVLSALSIGFRFLFYWLYVAEPSRRNLFQRTQRIKFLIFEYTQKTHNASWIRWGFLGKLIGAGLLVGIITITTLQIVWRLVPRFRQYGSVYATDAALELLISFLFLLKLLLNSAAFNLIDNTLVHTFSESLAPIFGLLVNTAIAIGNLLYFAFTESTVGRLLQAFEIYILVVFVTVTAFLRHCDLLLSTTPSQGGDVVFTLPEPVRGSTFRITPPMIETPRMSMILSIATPNIESDREMFRRSARRPLNHVSSLLSFRVSRYHSRLGDEEVKLWNADKRRMDPPYTGDIDIDTELRGSTDALTRASKERLELVCDASADHMVATSILHAESSIPRSMYGSIQSGQMLHTPRVVIPHRAIPGQVQASPVPVSSVPSSISEARYTDSISIQPDTSPLYGLGGIQPFASASDSRTSLDELLRQQRQLDQSMKALRFFSTETFIDQSCSNSDLNVRSVELTRSPSISQRTVCSDVSLSNFPIPPQSTSPAPPLPPSSSSSMKRIRGDRPVRLATARPIPLEDMHALVPPRTLASLVDIPGSPRFNSIPHTPTGEENESLCAEIAKLTHSDSGGLRYNVTSFIGDLAAPGRSCQGNEVKPWWSTEKQSSFGTIEAVSDMKGLPPHMPRVSRQLEASLAAAKFSPSARPSRPSQANAADESADVMHYQINDQTFRTEIPVTNHAEKGTSISPRNQLIRETGPPTGIDRVQRIFARRKPSLLAIQSYAEHKASTSRVQVLTDD